MTKQLPTQSAITTNGKRAPTSKGSRKHLKGPVVEVFIYRVIYGYKGRGGRRKYVANVLFGCEVEAAFRAGPGIYRLEYRDERRWIIRVRLLRVSQDGQWQYVRRTRAPGPRRFPAPQGRRPR